MRAAVRGVALTLILALAHVASAQDTADSTADRAASGSNGRRARLSDRGISFDFESGLTTTVALKPFALSADLQFVNPAIGGNDDVVAVGLRTTIRF